MKKTKEPLSKPSALGTMKHGSGSIMVWGQCVLAEKLIRIDMKIDGAEYWMICWRVQNTSDHVGGLISWITLNIYPDRQYIRLK